MKVGILTYHDGINFGGYLQVFSLFSWIKENTDHDVHVINFKAKGHYQLEHDFFNKGNYIIRKHPAFLINHNIREFIRIRKNKKKIRYFTKAHRRLRLSKFTHEIKDINKEKFDIILVGSDEIWNYKNPIVGYVPAYFGNGINKQKLASYGASFGSISSTEKVLQKVIDGIKSFDSISVRDLNTEAIVKEQAGIDPTLVCDPIFLIDHMPNIKRPHVKKDFLLVYSAEVFTDLEKEAIKSYAKKNKLKLIGIGFEQDWCDNVITIGPFEFLGYFYEAKKIVTKMFHGTLFSIAFEKQFCTLCTPYRKNKYGAIIERTGLSSRLLMDDTPNDMEKTLDTAIDYNEVTPKLKAFVEESYSYLRNTLSEIPNDA
jgi:hypothetical protein